MPASDRFALCRAVVGRSVEFSRSSPLFVSLVSCVGRATRWPTEGRSPPSTTPTPVTSTDAPQTSERSTNAPSTVDNAAPRRSPRTRSTSTASTGSTSRTTTRRSLHDRSPRSRPTQTPPTTLVPRHGQRSTRTTAGGYVGVDVGCAESTSYQSLDRFFAARVGPVLGWDYQHVYPLGGDRYLWLFQDAFIDHTGVVSNLGKARFVHNAALLQTGRCFTSAAPRHDCQARAVRARRRHRQRAHEVVLADGRRARRVATCSCSGPRWSRIRTTRTRPTAWAGTRASSTWRPTTRRRSTRVAFVPAQDSSVAPMYGYACRATPRTRICSGTPSSRTWCARAGSGRGRTRQPRCGWHGCLAGSSRHGPSTERPRVGRRVSCRRGADRRVGSSPRTRCSRASSTVSGCRHTKVDGYWGEDLAIDVAPNAWGPWTTVDYFRLQPRGNDPKMNSYHAHLLPWRDGFGSIVISSRTTPATCCRDAWPRPDRYRPMLTYSQYQPTPVRPRRRPAPPRRPPRRRPTTLPRHRRPRARPSLRPRRWRRPSTSTTTVAPTSTVATTTTTSSTTIVPGDGNA